MAIRSIEQAIRGWMGDYVGPVFCSGHIFIAVAEEFNKGSGVEVWGMAWLVEKSDWLAGLAQANRWSASASVQGPFLARCSQITAHTQLWPPVPMAASAACMGYPTCPWILWSPFTSWPNDLVTWAFLPGHSELIKCGNLTKYTIGSRIIGTSDIKSCAKV